ncbi:hypothetical protein [Thermoflexibacter ruber]|uniref:Uncharacterized protein n=1 Tax=Thermoflexibacter ruber TaxID=1003 RepID=A0A1I2AF94_9BACT|nr:hypothetical protein [Thermoflexibacter ruber]SFE42542.1 hypothetical protein SAMN04488541_1001147 [Thermoflexibacter ruber]
MDNDINFKDLWAKQKVAEPDKEELLLKMEAFKKENIRKIIFSNILLVATSAFIIFIWVYYQPAMLTTKIGIVLIVLAMAIYMFANNKNKPVFNITTTEISNKEYLEALLAIKKKQQFMQTTILNSYFVLLSLGIALYMYEYASKMSIAWALAVYGLTVLWILFNWFYFRPKQIKKQQHKLNEIISKFERLNQQIAGNQ